jgi:hypothetical protein
MPSADRKTTTCSGYLRQVNIPLAEIPSNCAKTANLQDHGPLEMADTETNVERDTTLGS